MDGFVKADEECYIILPSVHKQMSGTGCSTGAGGQNGTLGEIVLKAHVLPLSYEFP